MKFASPTNGNFSAAKTKAPAYIMLSRAHPAPGLSWGPVCGLLDPTLNVRGRPPYERLGLPDQPAADRHAGDGRSELLADRRPDLRPQRPGRSRPHPQQALAHAHG